MLLVFSTFPNLEKAREIAGHIIAENLAACVNILPSVESIYRWDGEIQSDSEVLAIFKVAADGYRGLEEAILARHPYETPEVVGIAADRVEGKYLEWVKGEAR